MIQFFKIQFHKRIFSVVLLGVLVFGGFSSYCLAQAGTNVNGYILKEGETVKHVVDESGDVILILDKNGIIVNTTEVSNINNDAQGFDVMLLNVASDLLKWSTSSKLYNDVFFSKTSKEGITMAWETVRGFVNMFYLLILVFLAITTILRVNKFSDKKLFFNVIISAILVNFSMSIALVVIDFSNMLMAYFAAAIEPINTANSFYGNAGYAKALASGTFWKTAGVNMATFIINIVMAVMLFFTAVALLIRLVAYWVLIIISPLAFFSIALPNSNGFSEWRDKLVYYSFFGPIMLFFIWLALALSGFLRDAFTKAPSQGENNFTTFIVSYIVVLYLLYYGHDKSKSMASKAGDFAGKIMDKGGKYAVTAGKGAAMLTPIGWAGAGGKAGGEALYTGTKAKLMEGKYTRNIFGEGRKKSQEELNRKAEGIIGGKGKKDLLEMAELVKTEKDMKDKYGNLDSTDTLDRIIKHGTAKEKMIAYDKKNKQGKLSGEEFKQAMAVGDTNALYKDRILQGANKYNKANLLKYHDSRRNDNNLRESEREESKKYFRQHIKGLLSPDQIDETNNTITDQNIEVFVRDNYNGDYKDAAVGGIINSIGSTEETAKFINSNKGIAKSAGKHYRGYGAQGLTRRKREILSAELSGASLTEIGRVLNGGGTTTSRIYTGTSRQSSARPNPAGGNFNGTP